MGFLYCVRRKTCSFTYKTEQAALSLRQFPGVAEQIVSAEGPEISQMEWKVRAAVTGTLSQSRVKSIQNKTLSFAREGVYVIIILRNSSRTYYYP